MKESIASERRKSVVVFEQIERILPPELLLELSTIPMRGMAEEIRLRKGRPMQVLGANEEYFGKRVLAPQDLHDTLLKACDYSIFAHQQEISRGYITLQGGHRIGICGATREDEQGRSVFLEYTGLNIRLANPVVGCAKTVLGYMIHGQGVYNTLILSPPKCGKTTMLRDIIRHLSSQNKQKVCVADERNELCPACFDETQSGLRTDYMTGMKKAKAMEIFIRAMAPDVIVTDELGTKEDIACVFEAAKSGTCVVASAHGKDLEEIKQKKSLSELWQNRIFERYIVLERREHAGMIKGIYDAWGERIMKGEEDTVCRS